MIRFFAAPDDFAGDMVTLNREDTRHIRSLRLRPGESFIVCDGHGTDYTCRLSQPSPAEAAADGCSRAEIIGRLESRGEPTVECCVFIAYSKGDRLEYAIQKSVELGAHGIALFESERCVVKGSSSNTKKTERYRKIALETAKQSGRGIVPEVVDVGKFNQAVKSASVNHDLAILCYEDEQNLTLRTVLEDSLQKSKSIAIITGPEGGFEPGEAEFAKQHHIKAVSLGPRILRCETAPAAALAAIMYHTGNL